MQSVKAKSSKWVNESKLTPDRFEWQRGFGAFSYSKSATKNVNNYIAIPEIHHYLNIEKKVVEFNLDEFLKRLRQMKYWVHK